MEKVLSIIIPVYNTEQYLRKCFDSLILPNKPERIEVIIVIDGSPDNSIVIAEEYQNKYPQIFRVINKSNGGHGSCCNVGIKEANGKYLRFLDSDDWYDTCFGDFVDYLETCNVDVISTNYVEEYVLDGLSKENNLNLEYQYDRIYNIEDISIDALLKFRFALARSTYKTSILRENQIAFREKTAYDDVMIQCAGCVGVKTLLFLKYPLYHYLLGRQGQTMDESVFYKKYYEIGIHTFDIMELYGRVKDTLQPNIHKYFLSFVRQRNATLCSVLLNALNSDDYKRKHAEMYDIYKKSKQFTFFDDYNYRMKRNLPFPILLLFRKILNIVKRFV